MTPGKLEIGNKLFTEIKEFSAISDYFRAETSEKPIEILCNFFTKCSNIGFNIDKQEMARGLVEYIKENLQTEITKKTKEFEDL